MVELGDMMRILQAMKRTEVRIRAPIILGTHQHQPDGLHGGVPG